MENSSRIRATRRVAVRECPHSSKKVSRALMPTRPRRSRQITARRRSVGECGRDVCHSRRSLGEGEGGRIELAVRCQRHRSQHHIGAGAQIVGKPAGQVLLDIRQGRVRLVVAAQRDIGDQTALTDAEIQGSYDGVLDLWAGQDGVLDFAKLNTETTDLDLAIAAADEV